MEANPLVAETICPKAEVSSENGEVVMKIFLNKTFSAHDIGDVLYLTVKEGCLTQRSLAVEIKKDLELSGFGLSDSDSHFSEMINNQSSNLYKYLHVILSIAKHQKLDWLAMYFAEACGGHFVKTPEHLRKENQ